ncbi:MAG TPA: prolyl oligopeptidase family serine peptidase [Acidimicrobiales bacterium]|nr:prolyl oligopeptidase family serine peptidase [Acidimicrobiales bacterium]
MEDRYAWLEDVDGERALAWVRERNARTESDLFDEGFQGLRDEILEVLEADDRIPLPSVHHSSVLNFWTDRIVRRGVLRRTSWDAYRAGRPDWDVLLDVDALGRDEGESWVYQGGSVRRPDRRRALVDLSPGGSDASVTREFDLEERRFVPEEEGGFVRPLSKGWLTWLDDDTVYVGHDFGPGSLTTSGYPRTIRRWRRGTPLSDAPVEFEGDAADVAVSVSVETLPGHRHQLFQRALDFYRSRSWILRGDELVLLEVPEDASVAVRERWLLLRLRSPWSAGGEQHAAGTLLAAELDGYLAGARDLRVVFTPSASTALSDWGWTRRRLLLTVQEHVRDRVELADPDSGWSRLPSAQATESWSQTAWPVDADESDDFFVVGQDFLHPNALYLAPAGGAATRLRSVPDRFDPTGLAMAQRFATSADGTRVPYFLVGPAAALEEGAPGPTVLTGYGGFEVSLTATYAPVAGRAWLAAGGRYAVANIRGGGEYGPAWHEAALRADRHRAYEDFEAVARDLISASVATPAQLGIIGGSNGGLLVGNMYVRTPELFGAVVCQAPLLDMRRYSHLLAGASWMAEYGDPDDPAQWEFIRTFSPYHLAEPGRPYPPVLFTTSTRDDRVHPGHARKMAARLADMGYDVTYWENIEGGHAGAADAPQQAVMSALAYTFLGRRLGLGVTAGR